MHFLKESSRFAQWSLLLLISWVGWRVWRFTITPFLRPNKVKELPYWIPYLGHGISFFRDIDGTVAYGRKHFKESEKTFSITVAGQELYIMTSPVNVSKALNSLQVFNYDKPIRRIMQRFGISRDAIRLLYEKPSPDFYTLEKSQGLEPNPSGRSMAEMGGTFLKKQLIPGEIYNAFETNFLGQVEQRMQWDSLSQKAIVSGYAMSDATSSKKVSLLELVRQTIVESTTVAFLGPAILEIDPSVIDNFLYFDDRLWVFLYQVPRPWAKSTLDSMDRLQRSLEKYLKLPKESRPGAAWLTTTLENEMRARGLEDRDIAGWLAMLFWVFNTNTWRLCFWVVAHTLRDPNLLGAIRAEISPVVQHSKSLSTLHSDLTRCKLLSSVYHETLRLVDSPISLRELTQPATSALGEPLPAGVTLLLAHRQLLTSTTGWGPNANAFDAARFVDNEALLRSKSYTPFGGGAMLCPGRFMARGEILVFLAVLISRFNVTTLSEFPRLDTKSGAGAGILGIKEGDDYLLKLEKRKDN